MTRKNRLHLDLRTAELAAEVSRILGLGASLLTDLPAVEDGWQWHIIADPDRGEFRVLQAPVAPRALNQRATCGKTGVRRAWLRCIFMRPNRRWDGLVAHTGLIRRYLPAGRQAHGHSASPRAPLAWVADAQLGGFSTIRSWRCSLV